VLGEKVKICLRNKGVKSIEMKRMRISKAQSVSEYSICVAIIILAIVVIQVYVKRGLQGRYADVVDFATTKAQANRQYEPYYQKEDLGFTQDVNIEAHVGKVGTVNKVVNNDSLTRKGEIRDLINYEADK
jgi:uncharacterized protein (UPF0333 family)